MLSLNSMRRWEWPKLHRYMVKSNFPDVPDEFAEARPFLQKTKNFGIYEEGHLKVALILGDITHNSAYLDMVCAPGFYGKWATLGVLKQIYDLIFSQLGLDFIWIQPKRPTSLKAALQAGFVYATPWDKSEPVMVLTKSQMKHKFGKKWEIH